MGKLKALIIDDDPIAQKLLTAISKKMGFESTVCQNGAEGLFHYCRDLDYTVIYLDLMMPEVDGNQFLQILDALHNTELMNQPANIIIQTAVTDYAYLKKLLAHKNVFSVRTKPINRTDLEADISRIVQMKNEAQPPTKLNLL